MRTRTGLAVSTLLTFAVAATAAAGDGNRLAYLDRGCDPYYPDLQLARLVTPQWIGRDAVDAAIVFSIEQETGTEQETTQETDARNARNGDRSSFGHTEP